MVYLLDTNILLRNAQPNHPLYGDAFNSVNALIQSGETLVVVPQVIVEFWTASTRPVPNNGLGFTPAQAEAEVNRIESVFRVLPESPDIFKIWKSLVVKYGVSGVETHDARIVAAMVTHGLSDILTFNEEDFRRYKEVTAVTPSAILRRSGATS